MSGVTEVNIPTEKKKDNQADIETLITIDKEEDTEEATEEGTEVVDIEEDIVGEVTEGITLRKMTRTIRIRTMDLGSRRTKAHTSQISKKRQISTRTRTAASVQDKTTTATLITTNTRGLGEGNHKWYRKLLRR